MHARVVKLKWLKELFKKSKIEEYNISSEELFDWFLEKTDSVVDGIKEELKLKFGKIGINIEQIRIYVENLQNATLRNENIPERAKQIMEGNRKTYCNFVLLFLENLSLPSEMNYDEIERFVGIFEEKIDSLNKTSAKSYYVLQEFFAHESGEIAAKIKEMDAVVRSLRNNNYKNMMNTKKKIILMNKMMESMDNVNKEAMQEKRNLNATSNMIENTVEQIIKLKGSKNHLEVESLIKHKKLVEDKIAQSRVNISSHFSALERPLKKYARVCFENKDLAEKYAQAPFETLLSDSSLAVLGILAQLENAILANTIDVKDREREKALEKIKELNRERFTGMLSLYNGLKSQKQDIEKKMRINNTMQAIEELEYKLSHLKEKVSKIELNIKRFGKQIEKYDLNKIKEELEDEINELLEDHISIILPEEKDSEGFEEESSDENGSDVDQDSEDESEDDESKKSKEDD